MMWRFSRSFKVVVFTALVGAALPAQAQDNDARALLTRVLDAIPKVPFVATLRLSTADGVRERAFRSGRNVDIRRGQLDRVFTEPVQPGPRGCRQHGAVHSQVLEPFSRGPGGEVGVVAFARLHLQILVPHVKVDPAEPAVALLIEGGSRWRTG